MDRTGPTLNRGTRTIGYEAWLPRSGDGAGAVARTRSARRGRALRLAGADDRRGGVRVDAVRRADLDVHEAGGGERRRELLLGERAGDAARPLLHIGLRRGVHVRIGD